MTTAAHIVHYLLPRRRHEPGRTVAAAGSGLDPPRVDQLDLGVREILGITGGAGRVASEADRGDLRISRANRRSGQITSGEYIGVASSGGLVERQHRLAFPIRFERRVDACRQRVLPPAVG